MSRNDNQNRIIPTEDYEALADEYRNTDATLQSLADRYGVTREAIRLCLNKVRPEVFAEKRDERNRKRAAAIWAAAHNGATTHEELARKTGLPQSSISNLIRDNPRLFQGLKGVLLNNMAFNPSTHRKCVLCHEIFPLDGDHFHRDRTDLRGFGRRCKACNIKTSSHYYSIRPDQELVATKKCRACQRVRSNEHFYRHLKGAGGLQTYCIECLNRMEVGESVAEIAASWGYEWLGRARVRKL